MGLIRAAAAATMSTMSDTWKDYFTCDALDNDVLMVKGIKKGQHSFFGNKSEDNYITDGSGVVVADGQCMIMVDDGTVVEVCAEPGLYTYDSHSAPSFFGGSFSEGIKKTFKEITKRFVSGGISTKDSRVYYFNTKEIIGNKFGTATPIPFRLVDRNIGLDTDISVRCNGEFSFRIADPLLFYTNVAGNSADYYAKENLDSQMRAEFIAALQPSLAKIAALGIRYYEVPLHNLELCDAMNEQLSIRWLELRGIKMVSVAINTITVSEKDEQMLKNLQQSKSLSDPGMAAGTLAAAQADAMRAAANNPSGAFTGFVGAGMAQGFGGMNAANLFAQAGQQKQAGGWQCACGNINSLDSNFCNKCGKPRPKAGASFCPQCGAAVNADDTFCPKCGKKLN